MVPLYSVFSGLNEMKTFSLSLILSKTFHFHFNSFSLNFSEFLGPMFTPKGSPVLCLMLTWLSVIYWCMFYWFFIFITKCSTERNYLKKLTDLVYFSFEENMVICFEDQETGRCLKEIPTKVNNFSTKM